jgi:hypothetical protein
VDRDTGTVLVAGSIEARPTAEAGTVAATVTTVSQVDSRVLAARYKAAARVDRMAAAMVDILLMVDLAREVDRSVVVAARAAVDLVDT